MCLRLTGAVWSLTCSSWQILSRHPDHRFRAPRISVRAHDLIKNKSFGACSFIFATQGKCQLPKLELPRFVPCYCGAATPQVAALREIFAWQVAPPVVAQTTRLSHGLFSYQLQPSTFTLLSYKYNRHRAPTCQNFSLCIAQVLCGESGILE
jgi:hypothetical protein